MLVRIVAMLTKLVERFDSHQYGVRQSAAGMIEPFEHKGDAAVANALARPSHV
jgi:hypothetical protein